MTSTQSYIKECDRAKEECLKNTDYLLLRFYESDLDKKAISVKQEIWQALCNTPRTRNNSSDDVTFVLDKIKS